MALKKQQQNEFAKILFVEQNLSQKEIAERVGVTEKTVGNWVKNGDWEKLKKSLLVTKKTQIARLYDQLEWLNNEIATRDREIGNVATSKEADTIAKITRAINTLETETSIGEIIEVATSFIDFVRSIDLDKAKEITGFFDLFINDKMK